MSCVGGNGGHGGVVVVTAFVGGDGLMVDQGLRVGVVVGCGRGMGFKAGAFVGRIAHYADVVTVFSGRCVAVHVVHVAVCV